jgi:Histidine kinase
LAIGICAMNPAGQQQRTQQLLLPPIAVAAGAIATGCWLLGVTQVLPWILMAGLIIWAGYRFPLEAGKVGRRVAFHGFGCLICLSLVWFATRIVYKNGPPTWVSDANDLAMLGQAPPWRLGGGGPPLLWLPLTILSYVALANLGNALAWSRRARLREQQVLAAESALARARLDALRMQLNPHFLFNALNGIATLIHSDPSAADEMLGNLSDMLRASLDTTNELKISLERELELLDHYLAIEHRRYGTRLRVERDFDADSLLGLVPTLLLQPLAENAVKHGIEHNSGHGWIRLQGYCSTNQLHLVVIDSGAAHGAVCPTAGGRGIGLTNTRARLEQIYGKSYTLSTGYEGQGFTVRLSIPYQINE